MILYPQTLDALRQGIDRAFARHTTYTCMIINMSERFVHNKFCA